MLPESSPSTSSNTVDWAAEARRAAAALTSPPQLREFGRIPQIDSEIGPHTAPAHVAGEQYRDEDGTWIVWVGPHCFIVSELPPLGLPDILARSLPTRRGCEGAQESRGDLFKDLPAYQKYHPQ